MRENAYLSQYRMEFELKPDAPFRAMDYMLWIHRMHSEFRRATGWGELPGNRDYQIEFVKWLIKRRGI